MELALARYARVLESTNDGMWEWNPQTDEIFLSARARELWGIPADAAITTRVQMKAHAAIHPDDRPATEETIRNCIERRDGFEMTYRVMKEGGQVRWLLSRGRLFLGRQGAPTVVTGSLTDITERKLALDALHESEARFRSLAALSSDWYWKQDAELRFTHMSAGVHNLAQLPPDTAIGKKRWELPGVEPLTSSWAEHRAVLEARKPFRDFELRATTQDRRQETRYISISGAPIFDADGRFQGYEGAGRNITERKRVEEALRLSEERYTLAMQASGVGHWDWKIPTDEYYASARWYELSGFAAELKFTSRTEALANYPFHPEDRPKYLAAVAEHFAGHTPRLDIELRIVVRGEQRWVRFIGTCLRDTKGTVVRWAGSSIDVTDRRRAEEELRTQQNKLRQTQRLEALGTLASGIAHDFNNILGVIQGYGEMAMGAARKGGTLRRDLKKIHAAGEQGRALVDRILAFSRSGMGERVKVQVEAVVREVLDLAAGNLPRGVRIDAKLRAGRAAMLGDSTQIHQVVANLVGNAIQAMPSGGVLRVSLDAQRFETPRTATVGVVQEGEYVVLEVADDGKGITAEVMERMFDPFFSTKNVGIGTGLGLSVVHGIVTAVGGAIAVSSTPGAGSTFTVYFPRSGNAEQVSAPKTGAPVRGKGEHVLVVDDEKPLVALATRTLRSLGYTAKGFTSSSSALSAFRAEPERFDALLTDERMPGMSGSSLIRAVRSIRPTVPVVLMSGYVAKPVLRRAYAAGANDVLKKPVSVQSLAASLARVLK